MAPALLRLEATTGTLGIWETPRQPHVSCCVSNGGGLSTREPLAAAVLHPGDTPTRQRRAAPPLPLLVTKDLSRLAEGPC